MNKEVLPPVPPMYRRALNEVFGTIFVFAAVLGAGFVFVFALLGIRGYVRWTADVEPEAPVIDLAVTEPFPEPPAKPIHRWYGRQDFLTLYTVNGNTAIGDAVGHWHSCTRAAPCSFEQFVSWPPITGATLTVTTGDHPMFVRSCPRRGCIKQSFMQRPHRVVKFKLKDGRWVMTRRARQK